ncbi:MAG: hypothetical protein GF331_03930 [Chitinivibrionales bacterium]|nr:hypothetical protein [Chitinivibrionales bacterium]
MFELRMHGNDSLTGRTGLITCGTDAQLRHAIVLRYVPVLELGESRGRTVTLELMPDGEKPFVVHPVVFYHQNYRQGGAPRFSHHTLPNLRGPLEVHGLSAQRVDSVLMADLRLSWRGKVFGATVAAPDQGSVLLTVDPSMRAEQ